MVGFVCQCIPAPTTVAVDYYILVGNSPFFRNTVCVEKAVKANHHDPTRGFFKEYPDSQTIPTFITAKVGQISFLIRSRRFYLPSTPHHISPPNKPSFDSKSSFSPPPLPPLYTNFPPRVVITQTFHPSSVASPRAKDIYWLLPPF
jgi:hypothetical protein